MDTSVSPKLIVTIQPDPPERLVSICEHMGYDPAQWQRAYRAAARSTNDRLDELWEIAREGDWDGVYIRAQRLRDRLFFGILSTLLTGTRYEGGYAKADGSPVTFRDFAQAMHQKKNTGKVVAIRGEETA